MDLWFSTAHAWAPRFVRANCVHAQVILCPRKTVGTTPWAVWLSTTLIGSTRGQTWERLSRPRQELNIKSTADKLSSVDWYRRRSTKTIHFIIFKIGDTVLCLTQVLLYKIQYENTWLAYYSIFNILMIFFNQSIINSIYIQDLSVISGCLITRDCDHNRQRLHVG